MPLNNKILYGAKSIDYKKTTMQQNIIISTLFSYYNMMNKYKITLEEKEFFTVVTILNKLPLAHTHINMDHNLCSIFGFLDEHYRNIVEKHNITEQSQAINFHYVLWHLEKILELSFQQTNKYIIDFISLLNKETLSPDIMLQKCLIKLIENLYKK